MGAMSANQKVVDLGSLGVEPQETEVGTDQTTSSAFVPSFNLLLGLSVALGLVVRIAFVSLVNLPPLGSDASWYRVAASNIASGNGYSSRFFAPPHKLLATAAHPPLFPVLLAAFDLLGLHSVDAQRLVLAIVTCTSVLVMGLLGRKVAGPFVGIVAALIAALNPLWLGFVGGLGSESLYLIVIALMLLLALRCLERPSVGRFVPLGLAIALAVLIRSEAIDFVVLLGVPMLIIVSVRWKIRVLLGLSFLAAVALMLAPWLIRNEVQLGGAVLSTQQGGTLAGSYCNQTFDPASPTYGGFSPVCALGLTGVIVLWDKPPDTRTGWTEVTVDRALTSSGEHYARQHLGQLPSVVLAREGLAWGLSNYSGELQVAVSEGRSRTIEQVTVVLYWVFIPFVLLGAGVLARTSWRRFLIVMVPILGVTINVAIFYGSIRFRVAAEPSLMVLVAVGIVTVLGRLHSPPIRMRIS